MKMIFTPVHMTPGAGVGFSGLQWGDVEDYWTAIKYGDDHNTPSEDVRYSTPTPKAGKVTTIADIKAGIEESKQTSQKIVNDSFYEMYKNFTECFNDQRYNKSNPDALGACEDCAQRGDFSNIIVTDAERKTNPVLDFLYSKTPSDAKSDVLRAVEERGPSGPGLFENLTFIKTKAPETVRRTLHGEAKYAGEVVMASAAGVGTGITEGLIGSPKGIAGGLGNFAEGLQEKLSGEMGLSDRITGGMLLAGIGVVLLLLIIRR